RRCASAFSAVLPFATFITEMHLGRLRGWCKEVPSPTICRRLEINDRPQTWWEPVSFHCQRPQPFPFPFPLKSMGETLPVTLQRERDLEWIWSLKHRAFPQGSGRWNSPLKAAGSPLSAAASTRRAHRDDSKPVRPPPRGVAPSARCGPLREVRPPLRGEAPSARCGPLREVRPPPR
ncbi:hypothetical protein KUCAC02_033553, partial [Chaenocephalus aceratus]